MKIMVTKTAYQFTINELDIVVYLVGHKEFKGIKIFGKEVIDFCGITN